METERKVEILEEIVKMLLRQKRVSLDPDVIQSEIREISIMIGVSKEELQHVLGPILHKLFAEAEVGFYK